MNKERRKNIRVPLILETCKWSSNEESFNNSYEMKNISNDGMFIKSDTLPSSSDEISILFTLPGEIGQLKMKGKIVRIRWIATKKIEESKGFGIQFIEDEPKIMKILDAYVTYLRNRQIIQVSKKIIAEFFGNKESPK